MASQQIILDHDRWRKGAGGTQAGPPGLSDSHAYAGLDLDLAAFTRWSFGGTQFSGTTFRQSQWSFCRLAGCSFTGCDLEDIAATDCEFVDCTLEATRMRRARLRRCTFRACRWLDVNLAEGDWEDVHLLQCTGTLIRGDHLRGLRTRWTGSRIQVMRLHDARLTGSAA